MLIYILKSGACLAILLVFYKLFLEKENMHVFKRFYLIGSLLFALIVPTIVFSEYVMVEPPIVETQTHALPQSSEIVTAEPNIPPKLEADVTDIAPLLWIIYFLGMLFFGLKFLRNLFQIFRRIRRNPKYKNSSFIQVLLQEKIPPHTFFKYIFLNKSKFESKEIPKEVLLHEETHARQKHSLDVVFIELLQVIFWVNPLIYFFKKAIKLNHEFLADSAVLNKDVDAVTYQNTLLSFLSSESAKKYQPSLPNAINYSSIKKRFTIMKSKTSKKSIVFRSFLLLPLLAILLFGFSEKEILEIPFGEVQISECQNIEHVTVKLSENGLQMNGRKFSPSDDWLTYLRNSYVGNSEHEEIHKLHFILINENNVKNDFDELISAFSGGVWEVHDATDKTPSNNKMIEVQKGATKEQLSKYNSLAKKYNAFPKTDRVIPMEDLKTLEQVFRKMTDLQKKEAQSFPECPQDGATKEQVDEYNALAKKYNEMIEEEENIWLQKGDVERLEYLHGLMTEEQRENAEPFPDFPEPPEPPMPPNSPDEEEMIEMEKQMALQERAMQEQEGAMIEKELSMKEQEMAMREQEGAMIQKEHAMKEQEMEMERQERIMEEQEIKISRSSSAPRVKKGAASEIPPPPTAAPVNVPVTPESAKNRLSEDLKSKNPSGEIIEVPESPKQLAGSPPPPPSPESPLDHIIRMAKKGATFYYEEKIITSDKAIEILKNNNEINIHSTGSKSKKPVVKLSTKPIKIGSTHNIQEKTKSNLQKVELVSLQSNETIEAIKIGKRLIEFKENFKNCSEFYFDGQHISENEAMHIYVNDPEIKISRNDLSVTGLIAKC